MASQAHLGRRSRTNDSGSYSDDNDSQSYDTFSLYSDDGSRSTEYLSLPGVRAKDLDRLIDDYLDNGLSRLIRKGARKYLADADSSKSSSFTTSLDDETEATSVAPSTDGSVSRASRTSRASAGAATSRRGAATPPRVDATAQKEQLRNSSLQDRIAAVLGKRDKAEAGDTAMRQVSAQEPARVEEEARAEKSTIRLPLKQQQQFADASTATTSMSSLSKEFNGAAKNEPNENRAPADDVIETADPPHIPRVTQAKQLGRKLDPLSDKDQILKDLRLTKVLDERQSSLKAENDSFEMLLQTMEKAAEQTAFERKPLTSKNQKMPRFKSERLWGSRRALWEKDLPKPEAQPVKARENRQRVTFAEKTQVFGEDMIWQRSLEQLEDVDIEEIIHNLSMKNASHEGKTVSLRDTFGNLQPSLTKSEPDVNFIRIPITPSAMQEHQETQKLPAETPREYQAPAAAPKLPITPLQSKNVLSSQSNSAKTNLAPPSSDEVLTKRADDIILTPQYVPFHSSHERRVNSAPPKVPLAQEDDSASFTKKGGLRQRARSKLVQKALSENVQTENQVSTEVQQISAPENTISKHDHSESDKVGHFRYAKTDGESEVEIFLATSPLEKGPHDEDGFSSKSKLLRDTGHQHPSEIKETWKSKRFAVKPKSEAMGGDSSIAVAILDQNSNKKAGASDDSPIEPVLTHVRLYKTESKRVRAAKTVQRHSLEYATKGSDGLATSTSHDSSTPVQINMTTDSVELQAGQFISSISDGSNEDSVANAYSVEGKRVTDFSLKRMLSIPERPFENSTAKDIAETPTVPEIVKDNVEITQNDDPSGSAETSEQRISPMESKDSSLQDADPRQSNAQQVDIDGQHNLPVTTVSKKKFQTSFMKKLCLKDNVRAEDIARPEDLDQDAAKALSETTASVLSRINVEDPDSTSEMTEQKGSVTTKNESNMPSLDKSREVDRPEPKTDVLAKQSAMHSVLQLLHHVRKKSVKHDESIVNASGGIEVAIEKSKEKMIASTGRMLLDQLRLQLGEGKRYKEPPTFEEAYKHLKSKVTPKNKKSGKETPVKEHNLNPVTSNTPTDTGLKQMPKSPGDSKFIVKRATACDPFIGLPILDANICGTTTPNSPSCQKFVLGAALKAFGAAAQSPVSLDLSDENSLIENADPATKLQVEESLQGKETLGFRKRLGAISRRILANKHDAPETPVNATGGSKDFRNDKRVAFLRLPQVRHANGEQTESQNQTEADDSKNADHVRMTSKADQASVVRSKKHRSRSRSHSRTRSSKSSQSIEEREKKLKIFEHAVERRLEADRALLKAIKAKMAASPHHHQETFLERLEDHLDVPTMCRGDQIDGTSPSNGVQTFAGTIGGILACANPVSALKAQSP